MNAELRPLVRMGAPAAWRRCPLDQWTAGRTLFRSTIWLFGGWGRCMGPARTDEPLGVERLHSAAPGFAGKCGE